MKSLAKMILCGAAVVGTAVFFTSCSDNKDSGRPAIIGQSIFVPNEMNAAVTVELEFDGEGTVFNTNEWFSVEPFDVVPGTNSLTVKVLELNTELTERVAGFMVNDGTNTQFYVIQDPVPGWDISKKTASVSGEEQSYTFSIKGNTDFDAVVEGADWLSIESITKTDSTLLPDNNTYSRYLTYNINLAISSAEENRSARIFINGADGVTNDTLEVIQYSELVPDFSQEFTRRSLAIRFTGNWCGYCPTMNIALHEAEDQYPGHIVAMNLYSGSGALTYSNITEWERYFNIGGYPTAYVNYYAEVVNMSDYTVTRDIFVNLAKEAADASLLVSNTILGGVASVEGDSVFVDVNIGSKAAGAYHVTAFLLEDGIIGQQADYVGVVEDPNHYEHSNVVRAPFTADFGDSYVFEQEGNMKLEFSMPIPASVQEPSNLHVVVYTTKVGTYSGIVNYASYGNYGYVVDNVVDIPVGEFVVFEYGN